MRAMSLHAEKRCQQRGVPPLIVELLCEYGKSTKSAGAEIFHFDKKSRKVVRRFAGRQLMAGLDKYLNTYLVYKDGCILTVGHRFKSIRNQ